MITSRNNRWLKDIRHLRTSKGRRRDPRLVLEGSHLVTEAITEGLELDTVLVTKGFLDTAAASPILELLPRPPWLVEAALLEEVADADSPRGLIAVAQPKEIEVPIVEQGVYIYADGLQDPGNLGALARVAEAAAVDGLFLSLGCVSPRHPRALRGSAGSLLRLPLAVDESVEETSRRFGGGESWFKLAARVGEDLYAGEQVEGIRILAVGAEGRGLSREVDERAGLTLSIPMAGRVESLNATVSAAVVLFEWQRRSKAQLGG